MWQGLTSGFCPECFGTWRCRNFQRATLSHVGQERLGWPQGSQAGAAYHLRLTQVCRWSPEDRAEGSPGLPLWGLGLVVPRKHTLGDFLGWDRCEGTQGQASWWGLQVSTRLAPVSALWAFPVTPGLQLQASGLHPHRAVCSILHRVLTPRTISAPVPKRSSRRPMGSSSNRLWK